MNTDPSTATVLEVNRAHAPLLATLVANAAPSQPWEDDRRFTVELTEGAAVLARRHTHDEVQARTFLAVMPHLVLDSRARRRHAPTR